ncbi:MAG: AAA family ATPase [Acidimicrobiia bacterium]
MVTRADQGPPSVLKAASKHKLLVAAITIVTAIAAVIIARLLPTQAVARASILLEDTATTDVLGVTGQLSQDRLVQNQLEVIKSGTVAARASAIAAEQGVEISIPDLLEDVDTTTVTDTDVINVSYAGDSERTALVVVSSVIQAFEEAILDQSQVQATTVLARLDSARDLLLDELDAVEAQVEETLGVRQIDGWIARVIDEIVAVENALATTTGVEARALLVTRSNQLSTRLATLRQAAEVETTGRSLNRLVQQRDELNEQLADLSSRTSAVRIEGETEGSGIAFVDPAQLISSSQGAGTVFTAGAGAALGFLLALGIASALSRGSDAFASRRDPEAMGIRLLADIPRIQVDTALPVRDAPRSAEAEAFRFVASNLAVVMDQQNASTVTFISATVGAGKSTLIANTAIATARTGKKVLVIDADFGNQTVSHLLLGKISIDFGLTELAGNQIGFEEAIRPIDTVGAAHLDLLSRGGLQVVAPDFFAQGLVKDVFERLQAQYDLIFIDSPPFLQVAYSGPVARLAGNGVLVIPHESSARKTSDLIERSQFLGIEILGYIYNMAPMNSELLESGGSMKDVLGDRGFDLPVKARSGR